MTCTDAFLTRPQERYQDSFIEAVYEYIGEKRTVNWHPEILRERFDEYLRVLRQAETDPLAGMVPATQLWLVAAGYGYIGDVDVRHCLNEACNAMAGTSATRFAPRAAGAAMGR